MKVLVTSTPGLGHVLPVRRSADELRRRGHDVRWVVGPDSVDVLLTEGYDVTVAGMPVADRLGEFFRRYPEVGDLPEHERRALAFSKLFGELAAPLVVEAVLPLVDEWPPDLVLHEAAELAGPLAAATLGVPSACHGFGEVMPELSVRRTGDEMAPHWAAQGLEPDRYAGCYRGLYVDIYPSSLRSEDMSHVGAVQPARPAEGVEAEGDLVYVTFGTVFNVVDDGFRDAVRAAADVAREVLVTVGPSADPAVLEALGGLGANVTVERFVPQDEVLPRCAAVVCHGGSGTLLASLAHGVPLLCLPRGADQFANAANVQRVGAGIGLLGARAADPTELAASLRHLLEGDEPRAAARRLAAEIAAMPSQEEVAAALEAVA